MKIGIYKHYKGGLYEVIGIAKNTENLENFVVYKALYDSSEFGNNALWIRPKNMFEEKLMYNGQEVFRFKYVGNETYKNI